MLKPEDISAEKIKSGVGGYKKRETEEFIDTLRNEFQALVKENTELKEENTELKDKLGILSEGVQYYKNMEKSLQKALVLAEKTTAETMQTAEVKAVAMEKEAQSRADIMIKEAKMRADSYEKEAKMRADSYEKEVKMRADSYEKEATVKADNLIHDAKQKADMAIAQGNEELRKIHSQIMMLVQQYEQYKSQYKQLAMAQMQVLESDAYNLDAPILQSISSTMEKVDSLNQNPVNTDNDTEEPNDNQDVVEPVNPSVEPENTEEKKVYVDARGEVVEVHEFREVTNSGNNYTNDPWETESDEDTTDDFDNFSQGYEGPFSFSESISKEESVPTATLKRSDDTVDESTPVATSSVSDDTVHEGTSAETLSVSDDTVHESTPVATSNVSDDTVHESTPAATSNVSDDTVQIAMQANLDVQPDQETINEQKIIDFDDTDMDSIDARLRADESQIEILDSEMMQEREKESTHHNGGISLEEMKRIEKMQLQRLKEQEEKQVAMLKSEHYRDFSNTPSSEKKMEPKKEQNHADIFRALHKNDDGEPTVTLQDLKHQQELDNSSVELPKASAQFISKPDINPMDDLLSLEPLDMTKPNRESDFFHQFSQESENDFHAVFSAEEGNSLEFEMDNGQNGWSSERKDTPKFKSFREFESDL